MFLFDVALALERNFIRLVIKNKNLCHGVGFGVGIFKSLPVKTHRRIDGMTIATCQEKLNYKRNNKWSKTIFINLTGWVQDIQRCHWDCWRISWLLLSRSCVNKILDIKTYFDHELLDVNIGIIQTYYLWNILHLI